jgi:hypothetical protein
MGEMAKRAVSFVCGTWNRFDRSRTDEIAVAARSTQRYKEETHA